MVLRFWGLELRALGFLFLSANLSDNRLKFETSGHLSIILDESVILNPHPLYCLLHRTILSYRWPVWTMDECTHNLLTELSSRLWSYWYANIGVSG